MGECAPVVAISATLYGMCAHNNHARCCQRNSLRSSQFVIATALPPVPWMLRFCSVTLVPPPTITAASGWRTDAVLRFAIVVFIIVISEMYIVISSVDFSSLAGGTFRTHDRDSIRSPSSSDRALTMMSRALGMRGYSYVWLPSRGGFFVRSHVWAK